MTSRLPNPGQDDGSWGSILNDFLSQSHNTDGTLKPAALASSGAATDTSVVHTTGNETIAGTKTFVASPVVPTPVQGTHAASKSYVDATAASGTPDATTTTKGKVQLAGDLGGTAAAPTVPGLAGKANTAHTHTAAQLSDSTTTGRSLLTAADAAAARTAIGAGTSNLALGTSSTSAKPGDYTPTKADVGLSNADNTSDAAKPVSTATQTALDAKAPLANPTFTGTVTVPAPTSTTDATTKGYVDLQVSSGTADATTTTKGKVQLAGDLGGTAAAPTVPGLASKANITHTHPVSNISDSTAVGRAVTTATDAAAARSAIGLPNVDNTSDAAKPVSTAQQAALDQKADASTVAAINGSFAKSVPVSAPAALRAEPSVAQNLSNGTDTDVKTSYVYRAAKTVKVLRLVFTNYMPFAAQGENIANTGDYTIVGATISYGGIYRWIYFNGSRSRVIQPGGYITSDHTSIQIPANTNFKVTTHLRVAAGAKWNAGPTLTTASPFVETAAGGATMTDLTLTETVTGTYTYPYGPSSVIVDNLSPDTLRIFAIGDSILGSSGDSSASGNSHRGWYSLAFEGIAIAQRAALSGERASTFLSAITGSSNANVRLSALSRGCNAAYVGYGTNDLAVGGMTLAVMQSNIAVISGDLVARGMTKVAVSTLLPVGVTSTDSWATLANQTVQSFNTLRVSYNAWLRDGAPVDGTTGVAVTVGTSGAARCAVYGASGTLVTAPSGPAHPYLAQVWEFGDTAENSRDDGKWKVNGTSLYATIDGTHPSTVTHTAMAANVPVAALRTMLGVSG